MDTDTLYHAKDFLVVKVKFNSKSACAHHLLWKQHSVRESSEEKPSNCTLFIINVPSYVDEKCLQHLFKECGHIRRVYFQKRPGPLHSTCHQLFHSYSMPQGYKVAYVVFSKSSALQNALRFDTDIVHELSTEDCPIKTGLKKYIDKYSKSFFSEKYMKDEILKIIEKYDREQELKEAAKSKLPDEEGWVTISSKKPKIVKPRQSKKSRRKGKKLVNFYGFQQREMKMEHLANLRKKFEEDKKRIASMRASRRFRPY